MSASEASQTPRFRLEWLVVCASLLLLGVVMSAVTYREHARLGTQEAERLLAQARVIDDNLIRQLDGANRALIGVRDDIERSGVDGAAATTTDLLRRVTDAMPGIRTLAVVDARGLIVSSSRAELIGIDSSRRDFFTTPRQRPDRDVLFVSEPFKSPLGPLVGALGRVLTDAEGRFAGVVVATLDPEYFQVVLRSVLYAPDMRTWLVHGDGMQFVNAPPDDAALGTASTEPTSLFMRHRLTGQRSSLLTGRTAPRGDERMTAWRTLGGAGLSMDKPLVAVVSRELSAIDQPWRQSALHFGIFYTVVVASAVTGLHFSQRRRKVLDRLAADAAKDRQESAERLELALRGANLGLWDLHVPSDTFVVNARERSLLGFSDDQELPQGPAWRELIHPDDRAVVDAAILPHLRGQTDGYGCEHRMRHRDGHYVWLSSQAMIVKRDAAGRPVRIVGTHLDITERKRVDAELHGATEQLRRSEDELRQVTDNLPVLLSRFDRDQRFSMANKVYHDWLGIESASLLGRSLQDVYGERSYSAFRHHIEAALAGQSVVYERDMATLHGLRRVEVTLVPRRASDGSVEAVYALVSDVTERRDAELQRARSERRLKSITDTLPALIAWVDRTQTYRFANARFKTQMGADPDTVIGQTMKRFLGADFHAQIEPAIEAALAGQHQKFERTGWKQNAETHFLVEYVPEFEADGAVAGFLVMVLDITERRRMELALAQSEQRLRAIADNLPAMISHFDRDLRYTFANAKVGDVFGCDAAGLIGRSASEAYGERAAGAEPWMRRALAGEAVSFEVASWDRDQQPQFFEASYVPDRDASGQVVGFYALTFEVTRRKQAEAKLAASQRLLDRTGSIAGVGGWELELETARLSWTAQTRRIHEVEDDFVPSVTNAIDFYVDAGRAAIDRAVLAGMEAGTPWDLVLPLRTAKDRPIWIRCTGEVVFEEGRPVRMFGAFQDVTAHVDQERQLREQAELLQVTLKSIGDGVVTTDPHGVVQWMNPAAERMTGWTSERARGRPSAQVFHVIHADTRSPAPDPVALCLRTLGASGLPSRSVLVALDGREFAIEDSAAPIRDEFGIVRGAVLVFHDVSEQRRMNDQMEHRATHDELTGLVNRAEFETRLARVLAQAQDDGVGSALMFIDLDQFKLVNDSCGHAMGDKLLCQVSDLMRATVRNRDTLARLGGDEFGVLLEHCTVEQAQRVAQAICDRMDEFRFVHDGRRFRVGASIGLVPVDARWPTQEALCHAADTACYTAKEAGRNRVHVGFDSDDATRDREGETQWGSRLEDALDDGDFVLYAQRIERSRAGPERGLHFEVLIRLREADGTIVEPGRFLPAAERFHMASRIDRWVVRRVFEWLVEAVATSGDAIETVAINLSGQSIGDRAFHRDVVQLLQEVPVDPRKVCFEVTETSAITNLADATAFIQSMRGLGMRIALDDFGAGASSFGYLKNLPVDYLKIDGQFIRNIERDPLDMAAVRCFHDVARTIGVQTVAEFVETPSIRTVLEGIGIDFLQGYLIHRPEPIDDLLRRFIQTTHAVA